MRSDIYMIRCFYHKAETILVLFIIISLRSCKSVFENAGKLSGMLLKPFVPQPTMVFFETASGERQAT